VESSELINQSLYYLSWIQDHRGDFEKAVDRALGNGIAVDWSDIRVICIAPGYKKYDLHAVKTMGANIELWQYRLFDNRALYLEEVFRNGAALMNDSQSTVAQGKNPVMVAAGKKAALTRATGHYTIQEHIEHGDKEVSSLVRELRDFVLGLDEAVAEAPKKFYVAYKVAQNFVCMEVRRNKITLFLKLDPSKIKPMPPIGRDVGKIGHYGTGDFELTLKAKEDLETAQKYIRLAFERIGG